MTMIESRTDELLVAHLLRRAGFGGTTTELRHFAYRRYEDVVDELVNAEDTTAMPQDIIRRYHVDMSDLRTRSSKR